MKKVLVLTIAGLFALPATGQAFKFGSNLKHEPDNSAPAHSCATDSGGGDLKSPCSRVGIAYPSGGKVKAPHRGIVTKFRVRAGAPGTIRFKLVRVRHLNVQSAAGDVKAKERTKKFHVKGRGFSNHPIETFHVHEKLRKGDYIAIDSGKTAALRCNSGSTKQLMFFPTLKLGAGLRHNDSDGSCELMVQAVARR